MKECGITRLCSHLAHTSLLVCCLIFFLLSRKDKQTNKTKTKAISGVVKEVEWLRMSMEQSLSMVGQQQQSKKET